METVSTYLFFIRGIHLSPIDFTHKGTEVQCFLSYQPKQSVEETVILQLICDTLMLMWHHCNDVLPVIYSSGTTATNTYIFLENSKLHFLDEVCYGDSG